MTLVCSLTSCGVLVSLCFFCISLCVLSFFLSHYNLISPLVPSSGNFLNNPYIHVLKLRLSPFNKVVVTHCENRCQPIEATGQIMTNMIRKVSSLIDNLAMSRIPHYLIPLSLVQNFLTSATVGPASPIQTHLAFSEHHKLKINITSIKAILNL